MRPLTLITAMLLTLLPGCRQQAPSARARKQPPNKKTAPAAPELPRLKEPSLPPAERIVDLFYTANVAAEAEPCG